MEKDKKLNLADLVGIEFLQDFQDTFAKTTNVASIMVDDEGPITKPSNFTDFCIKYTRGSDLGYKRCNQCDINFGKTAAITGEPVIYTCHTGLTDFAVPIMLEGKHIASILGGQVLTKKPNKKYFRKIARELGINEDEYIKALGKIKIVPIETVKAAANLLYFVANTISEMSLKNLELIKKTERNNLYRRITETIRSSLNVDETLTFICDEVAKLMNVQRATIVHFPDPENYETYKIRREYKRNQDIKGLTSSEYQKKAAAYWGYNLLNKDKILAFDNIQESNTPDYFRGCYNSLGVKSMIGLPIKRGDNQWGSLVLSEYNQYRHWTDEEKKLLETISDQIFIAINQAELYETVSKTAERERLFRKITETIRSSSNIDETLTFICEEVAKLINVQRATILQFPTCENYEKYTVRTEYKSSPEIKGLSNSEYTTKTAAYWGFCLLNEDKILAFDNIQESDTPDYFKKCYASLGVKSMIGFPIKKEENQWGLLVLSEYNSNRHWSDEEKKLLETISDQIYIAINQAELHNALKQNIANQNAILNNMPFMAWLKDSQSRLIAVNNEYAKMCNDEIENILGKTDFDFFPESHAKLYINEDKLAMEKRQTISSEDLITGPNGAKWHETIKSPVIDSKGNVVGTVGLARDVTERKEAELELIRRQEQISKANERESLLRKIFETMRSSLDINSIKSEIVTEIGKALGVDICFIMLYNPETELFNVDKYSEYRSSTDKISFINFNLEDPSIKWFVELFKNNKELNFANVDEFITENNLQGTLEADFIKGPQYGLKSSYNVPIYYANTLLGYIVLEYTEDYKTLEEDDLIFLKTIATQAGIALHQANLYKITQTQAERESALRTIMLSAVSTFDIKEVINSIVSEAGKLFKSDRCLFVEFNYEEDAQQPIKNYSEYLSSKDIKSHITSLPDKDEHQKIMKLLKERNVLSANNTSEITLSDSTRKMLVNDLEVKSYLVVPVYYGEVDYGEIVLHYVNHFKHFSQDDINLAQAFANQSAIVINQAKLYETIQRAAENERVLREIMLSSVNTFDMKKIINSIVIKTGELLKTDRCLFVEYDPNNKLSTTIQKHAEYLSSNKILSHSLSQPGEESTKVLHRVTKRKEILIVNDTRIAKLTKESRKMLVDDLSVKSYLIMPVYYGNIIYGSIILHYVNNYMHFTQEEIDVIQAIANQTALVLHQAKLYSTIEKNEKYTRIVLDNIKDGIITISDDFIIESCNPAIEIIWGYTTHEIIGKNLDLLLHHDCKDKNKKSCLSSKESYGIRKGGEEFPVEIDVSEIIFNDKKITLLVIRDITERRKVDKMKSEFVSTVSHELRTPLTAIKGSLGLITSGVFGELPEKANQMITIANNNCTRLTNLINDILDLEKIKAGKMEFKYEELEINSVLEQAIILHQPYAEQFEMKMKFIKKVEESYIKVDKNRVLQVISNLMSNAVKFSNPGGEVTVITERKNDIIKISVQDKGMGIPEHAKHKIFTSFSQVDSSDTRSKGGTGLGLSISKLIIEKMGGEIGFESTLGKGSTFFFTLPTTAEPSPTKEDDGEIIKDLNSEEDTW